MRMLAIHDGTPESCLALLEELGIITTGDSRRIQAAHEAKGQLPGPKITLRHGHEPITGEHLVSATRPALLLDVHEKVGMEHQPPFTEFLHQHGMCNGGWLR